MGVTVSAWITEYLPVAADEHEVHPPCVYAYRLDSDTTPGAFPQTTYDLIVQGVYVPVELPSCLDKIVWETGHLLKDHFLFIYFAYYSTAACGAEVYSEEAFVVHSMSYVFLDFRITGIDQGSTMELALC